MPRDKDEKRIGFSKELIRALNVAPTKYQQMMLHIKVHQGWIDELVARGDKLTLDNVRVLWLAQHELKLDPNRFAAIVKHWKHCPEMVAKYLREHMVGPESPLPDYVLEQFGMKRVETLYDVFERKSPHRGSPFPKDGVKLTMEDIQSLGWVGKDGDLVMNNAVPAILNINRDRLMRTPQSYVGHLVSKAALDYAKLCAKLRGKYAQDVATAWNNSVRMADDEIQRLTRLGAASFARKKR